MNQIVFHDNWRQERKLTSAREREKLEVQHAQATNLLNVKLAELRRVQASEVNGQKALYYDCWRRLSLI